jgi:ribosomal protein S1
MKTVVISVRVPEEKVIRFDDTRKPARLSRQEVLEQPVIEAIERFLERVEQQPPAA